MSDTPELHDALDFHQAVQAGLPVWLRQADPRLLAELVNDLRQSRLHRARVKNLLSPLAHLPAFARTEMIKAMAPVYGGAFDPQRDQICLVSFEPELIPSKPTEIDLRRVEVRRSLLQAALDNFEADETEEQALGAYSYLLINGKRVASRPEDFARRCRELDLGGRFQAQLRQLFQPADGPGEDKGTGAKRVHALLEEQRRFDMRVAASLAYLRGDLTELGFRLMQNLAVKGGRYRVENIVVQVFRPRIFGVALREVLVIAQGKQKFKTLGQADSLLLYIPGEKQGALREYASVQELAQDWLQRLAVPGFSEFVLRFVSVHERAQLQAEFESRLSQALEQGELSIDYESQAFDRQLFRLQVTAQLFALSDDARRLAVPTAVVDAQARQRRLEWYEAAGLDVLAVAGLLVPAVGQILLGVAAVDLAHEVYEGFHAWRADHHEEAIEHLERALEQVAGVVALGTLGLAAQGLLRASGFMGQLHVVRLDSGEARLWHPELSAYRQPSSSGSGVPGEHPGLFDFAGRSFLRHRGGNYAVARGQEGWRIQPADVHQRYAPPLVHNGDGGWLHEGESPWQWTDPVALARRLGHYAEGLSDYRVGQVLAASGYDSDALRQVILEHSPVPALLADAFEQLVSVRLPVAEVSSRSTLLLRSSFAQLSPRAVHQLTESATDIERQFIARRGLLPATLVEKATRMQRELRLGRALLGFLPPATAGVDTARLAVHLVPQLPGWPAGEVLSISSASLEDVARGHGNVLENLFRALPLSLQTQLENAQNLGEQLASRALMQRRQCAQLLGLQMEVPWWRAPGLLADGRIGYALSGRGRLAAIHPSRSGQVRALYPGMSDGEIDALVVDVQERGLSLGDYLAQRKHELTVLEATLRSWEADADGLELLEARKRVSRKIHRAWSRQSERAYDAQGVAYGLRLDFRGARIGELPALEDCSFESVVELTLTDMDLSSVPEGFFGQFPDLQHLSLDHNRLERLPDGIVSRTALKSLNLAHNRLSLAGQPQYLLAGLARLEVLTLADNPLTVAPDLGGMPLLRRVQLQGCQLETLPSGLVTRGLLELADLRDNRIAVLPMELASIPRVRAHCVLLADNPLQADSLRMLQDYALRTGANLGGLTERHPALQQARYYWLELLTGDIRGQRAQQWATLEHESGAPAFFDLLARLGETADYRLARDDLQRRVWALFDEAWSSARLRGELFDLAASDVTCGDSVALHFSALEVRMLVHKAGAQALDAHDGAPLLDLALGLFRLERLDAFADEELASRPLLADRARDQVEVRLVYRLALARALELPGQPRAMLYPDWAGVTQTSIDQAQAQVLADEQTVLLPRFIESRDFWQQFLRTRYAARFTAMDAPFRRQLEWAEVRDSQYYREVQRISAARQRAFDDLVHELTLAERAQKPGQSPSH
ncbi:NEL-type E3 ubiquitin ligase domain-containing protein [Pseudomonas sp. BJa5]|uniref:NEL-type E3 ubiquitin ligase domain-containing protein n=1 Tax=Pseudomonas sp. BJa5 TaxID=2936270 RepID=UPI0025594E1B|nr:NEL-type E3 ubiquitin ligase domain-containing protein [Pseudomonas sp. BGr12]MDL2421121.1 hypothetical protein [Pseudomonas sp. BGr12]